MLARHGAFFLSLPVQRLLRCDPMPSIRLLKNGEEIFPAIYEDIGNARSCVAVEMYSIADDETGREFRDHLVMAARRGIQVSVLVDALGSWQLTDIFWSVLREAGGAVRWFRALPGGSSVS
jgi:cardiolipin synthase